MILDSSAIIAILFREPDHEILVSTISEAKHVSVSSPTLVETGIVASYRLKSDGRPLVEQFLAMAEIHTINFTKEHYFEAVSAFLKFGKGQHPAKLNFGDCITYATAKLAKRTLLYIGDDFSKTDIVSAIEN